MNYNGTFCYMFIVSDVVNIHMCIIANVRVNKWSETKKEKIQYIYIRKEQNNELFFIFLTKWVWVQMITFW